VGELLSAVSPAHQLRRKLRFTKLTASAETVTYLVLIPLMFRRYALHVHEATWHFLLRRVTAYAHGIISVAYGVMILDVYRAMKWSKRFALLCLAGPPGAIVALHRIRHQEFPADVRADQMLF
jgi:Domain of unknown function (DUF3817)